MGLQRRTAGEGDVEIRVDTGIDLKEFFADLKELDPAIARQIRARMRNAGKGLIAAMKRDLDEPPPGLVTSVKKETRVTSRTSSRYRAGFKVTKRSYVTDVETSGARGRSRGSREEIKAKLRSRVMAGARSQGLRISGSGEAFAKAYNKKRFRHPVFGDTSTWIDQAGNPYFEEVIWDYQKMIEDEFWAAIDEGLMALGRR